MTDSFDPALGWRRSPKVGLRPEPFGALAYHFDTRRLVFLKSPALVALVEALADHPSAIDAIEEVVGGDGNTQLAHVRALESLAGAGVIEQRASAAAS